VSEDRYDKMLANESMMMGRACEYVKGMVLKFRDDQGDREATMLVYKVESHTVAGVQVQPSYRLAVSVDGRRPFISQIIS